MILPSEEDTVVGQVIKLNLVKKQAIFLSLEVMLIVYKGFKTELDYLSDKVDQGFKDMRDALQRTNQDMRDALQRTDDALQRTDQGMRDALQRMDQHMRDGFKRMDRWMLLLIGAVRTFIEKARYLQSD